MHIPPLIVAAINIEMEAMELSDFEGSGND